MLTLSRLIQNQVIAVVIKGSDIGNAVQTNPVVITPDTAFDIPWRGALVYVNDREGKITKINLTDMDKEGVVCLIRLHYLH